MGQLASLAEMACQACQAHKAHLAHLVHHLELEPYTEQSQVSLASEENKVRKETQDSRE